MNIFFTFLNLNNIFCLNINIEGPRRLCFFVGLWTTTSILFDSILVCMGFHCFFVVFFLIVLYLAIRREVLLAAPHAVIFFKK